MIRLPGNLLRAIWSASLLALLASAGPRSASAQYSVASPAGDTLMFQADSLRRMLDTARALFADLQEDPRVGYFLDFGESAAADQPEPAFPWNAVEVVDDSSATVMTPGNLREADRAYYNYAVMRMRAVRQGDPDVSCDSLLALEEEVVASFAEGWILARTLFGGPSYSPLDAIAFARAEGLLRPLIAAERDRYVGACASEWAEANQAEVERYVEWKESFFGTPADEAAPDPDPDAGSIPSGADTVPRRAG